MKAVDTLAALNYRADYSGRMAPGLFLWLTFTECTHLPLHMHVNNMHPAPPEREDYAASYRSRGKGKFSAYKQGCTILRAETEAGA